MTRYGFSLGYPQGSSIECAPAFNIRQMGNFVFYLKYIEGRGLASEMIWKLDETVLRKLQTPIE